MAFPFCHWHNLNLTLEKPVTQRGAAPKGHHVLGTQLETHCLPTYLKTDLQPPHKLCMVKQGNNLKPGLLFPEP